MLAAFDPLCWHCWALLIGIVLANFAAIRLWVRMKLPGHKHEQQQPVTVHAVKHCTCGHCKEDDHGMPEMRDAILERHEET